MKKQAITLLFSLLVAVILCGAVSAGDNVTISKTAVKTGADTATVTITINGPPANATATGTDVVYALDCSGSMSGTPLQESKDAANNIVNKMNSTNQQAAVVNWDTTVQTSSIGLTTNYANVHTAINAGVSQGTTNMAAAIQQAITYLDASTMTGNTHNIILLSDGGADSESAARAAAQAAAAKGYKIFTIGFGDNPATAFMTELATITGGKYYAAPSGSDLDKIYNEIFSQLNAQTATNITVTDVVPSYISLVGSPTIAPSSTTKNADGTTTLVWNVGSLSTGQTWTASYNVKSSQYGTLPTNVQATVSYNDPEGIRKTATFPVPTVSFSAATTSGTAVSAVKTVGMQTTGVPLAGIISALFLVLGGLLIPRRK